MSDKIPTAEEFLLFQCNGKKLDLITWENTLIFAKNFSEFHVEAALRAASEQAKLKYQEFGDLDLEGVDKKSILNAYPKTNVI